MFFSFVQSWPGYLREVCWRTLRPWISQARLRSEVRSPGIPRRWIKRRGRGPLLEKWCSPAKALSSFNITRRPKVEIPKNLRGISIYKCIGFVIQSQIKRDICVTISRRSWVESIRIVGSSQRANIKNPLQRLQEICRILFPREYQLKNINF